MAMLEHIKSPLELKKLKNSELRSLAQEIRVRIIETIGSNGGHLASNLGVIELTIALHKVFDSPHDALVWDVGHQSYTHKLLTGRAERFSSIRKKNGLSGFPKRSESPHDIFETGHSSTSISLALGLLEARSRAGDGGKVVAVIGDGALTAGMAFEALSNVAQLALPLIIVLNDNKMSISPNVGALSRYLSRLSASVRYQTFRRKIDSFVESIPHFGHRLMDLIVRGKRAVKAIFFKDNFFSDLGFEYIGPIYGHAMPVLIQVLEQAKRLDRPVVIHVITTKGKGYDRAEDNPEAFHGVSPFCEDNSAKKAQMPAFTQVFGALMVRLAEERKDIVAITAAMARGTGLEAMARRFPSRVYDVGIAEQHSVTFAAGLASGKLKPVVAIYSTFAQRAIDQIAHDVCLPNKNVIFALDRAGAVGEDGETHQGLYDIALLKALPNITILAPSCAAEMESFFLAAIVRGGPVVLRYPKAGVECDEQFTALPLEWGRGVFARKYCGSKVLVCALGPLAHSAARVSDMLAKRNAFFDVYSLRFAAPLNEDFLAGLCADYKKIIVLEDGVVNGGVGDSIASILARRSIHIAITFRGFGSMPPAQATREELLHDAGLDDEGIWELLSENTVASGKMELYEQVPLSIG
jgi:1-deoxy-D-xylulose-5-phosphate synthase